MRPIFLSNVLFCLVICQCSREPVVDSTGLPIEWIEASRSLEYYRDQYPERPILAVFGADWDMNGVLFRKLLDEKATAQSLSEAQYVFLWYNCTNGPDDGVAWAEAKRLARGLYDISFAVVSPENGQSERIESLRVAPQEIDNFIATLIESSPDKMPRAEALTK